LPLEHCHQLAGSTNSISERSRARPPRSSELSGKPNYRAPMFSRNGSTSPGLFLVPATSSPIIDAIRLDALTCPSSGDQLLNDPPMHVGQAEVAAGVAVSSGRKQHSLALGTQLKQVVARLRAETPVGLAAIVLEVIAHRIDGRFAGNDRELERLT